MSRIGNALLVLALGAPGLAAQPAAGPDSAVRRAMALAYLRVELAARSSPIPAEKLAATNQAFDRATLGFFGGQYAAVVAQLDSLAAAIETEPNMGQENRRNALLALDKPSGTQRRVAGENGFGYRWYRPARPKAGPSALVIALHGAGADETAFLEAYGAGRLRRMADSLGFVVATPLTPAFMRSSANLSALLDDLSAAGPIDRNRVYLLGHSLGAAAAWRLAQERPTEVRAVVCIAGAGRTTADQAAGRPPPTLLFAGELDPIAPVARLRSAVEAAQAAGWPIEYRQLANQGHTLMVGAVLDSAVTWLLNH